MIDTKPRLTLEQFEGPYDLLLELVRARELDVSSLSLTAVTDSFLEYIHALSIKPELMADFLVVASTLLLLKIRSALPTLNEEEQEEITELTDRVKIYELYRQQAEALRHMWKPWVLLGPSWWAPETAVSATAWPALSPKDIHGAFQNILSHLPKRLEPTAHLITRGRTLQQSLVLFQKRLEQLHRFDFEDETSATPQDKAVSFLAVLELARQQTIRLQQEQHFGTILIEKI